VHADGAALLRQHGIQVTAQRLAVMKAVSSLPHTTAYAVAEAVRGEIGTISLQSVYDALSLLVTQGLIRRIQPAGSPARYEDRVGDNHHHLICRVCGRVVDVDCAIGSAPCLAASHDRGYEIDEAEVAYWGRCPDCLAQSRQAARSASRARRAAATGAPASRIKQRSEKSSELAARASLASEPRDRSEPAKRRARARVGESAGQSPSAKE